MPDIFFIMFFLVFFLVLGTILFNLVRGVSQWNRNNHSPRLTVEATVVTKRSDVSHHHHQNAGGTGHTSSTTTYYVTFQVESGWSYASAAANMECWWRETLET